MTYEKFLCSLNYLDIKTVENFVITDLALNEIRARKRLRRKRFLSVAVAVCLVAVIAVAFIPLVRFILNNAQIEIPAVPVSYSGVQALSEDLTRTHLYESMYNVGTEIEEITVYYSADKNGGADKTSPLNLSFEQRYQTKHGIDNVLFYVAFGNTDVNSVNAEGYKEQDLTASVNGVTVYYSLSTDNGIMRACAKFVYGEDLYVVTVNSEGYSYNLVPYLEILLGDIDKDTEKSFSQPPEDFSIRFTYKTYSENDDDINIYDTKEGFVQKDIVDGGVERADFTPDAEVLEDIFSKLLTYKVLLIDIEVTAGSYSQYDSLTKPTLKYDEYCITVTANGRVYEISGDESAYKYSRAYESANNFSCFTEYMKTVMQKTPEYRNLPEAAG